jgi:hypothetical protein
MTLRGPSFDTKKCRKFEDPAVSLAPDLPRTWGSQALSLLFPSAYFAKATVPFSLWHCCATLHDLRVGGRCLHPPFSVLTVPQ